MLEAGAGAATEVNTGTTLLFYELRAIMYTFKRQQSKLH
jgi:hypothetical protein